MRRRKSVFAPTQELSLDDLLPHSEQEGGHRKLEIADWSALPDDQVLRAELRDVIHQAIQELPEIYRAVILLRDVEELNTDEAAQVLDVTPESVKTRLHRARLAVRQKLDKYLRNVQGGVKER
jgi:RNA polymerase sigma-70 factor (ECF subfamily)